MKELGKALKISVIFQLICWAIFILIDENRIMRQTTAEEVSMLIGIIILIGMLVLYFIKANKYISKNQLKSTRFNIFLAASWILFSIAISFILLCLVDKGYLHVCRSSGWGCFLNGIEYAIECFFMILQASIFLLIKSIIRFYKYIKNKKSTS